MLAFILANVESDYLFSMVLDKIKKEIEDEFNDFLV